MCAGRLWRKSGTIYVHARRLAVAFSYHPICELTPSRADFFFVITFCGNCAKERKKGKQTTQGGTAARGYFFSPESEGWPPSASRCAPNHFGGAPLPCASVAPSRPSRPPGMSTGKEASVPSGARRPRTDPTAASAPPAKRPRDSEGSHQLKVGRKRHTTVPSRAFYTARRRPRRGALRRTCFKPQDGGAERESAPACARAPARPFSAVAPRGRTY